MRNNRISPQQNNLYSLGLDNLTPEEHERIRVRMLLISNYKEIKLEYAKYIFKVLEMQYPKTLNYDRDIYCDYKKSVALEFILKHIISCEEYLVLCNPDNDPSVVVSAYDFIFDKGLSKDGQVLIEYMAQRANNSYSEFDELSKKTMKNGAKLASGYALQHGSDILQNQSNRLNNLSKHYSSNHATNMRITHSTKGKLSQQKAFSSSIAKSSLFAKQAAQRKMGGKILATLANNLKKGSFKPVGYGDIFLSPTKTATSADITAREKSAVETALTIALKEYCSRNNNYLTIVNQQYFEQK